MLGSPMALARGAANAGIAVAANAGIAAASVVATSGIPSASPTKRQRISEEPKATVAGSSSGGTDGDNDDWRSMVLPPFAQPPKPAVPAGLDALARLAKDPEAQAQRNIFLKTRDLVVAYDLYPKAAVHLLILPRDVHLDGPTDLTAQHVPLIKQMARLAAHLAASLRASEPTLAPFAAGFHAAPSMRQRREPGAHTHALDSPDSLTGSPAPALGCWHPRSRQCIFTSSPSTCAPSA